MALAPKKISLIHIAKSRIDMTDDDYRAMLLRVAGVGSSRELDDVRFEWIMTEFQRLGFQSDFGQRNIGNRHGMASPQQIEMIRNLWATFTEGKGTDASLGIWLERQFKVSALRFLSAELGQRAIGALIAMNNRRVSKVAAHGR